MNRVLFAAFICLSLACSSGSAVDPGEDNKSTKLEPTVILISIDGFRWDYMSKANTPNLDLLVQDGVKAESLIPVFPTKTFPNHYSIVTGLYAENHGIVSNTMYDPEYEEWFTISNPDAVLDGKWWGGEPIWVTNELQGKKSATYFWVGSESEIKGTRPSYYQTYNPSTPHSSRVNQVLSWLDQSEGDRPNFISLYFSNVDSKGHGFGPDSDEVASAIEEVDGNLGQLVSGLKSREIYDEVNILIVSDHGMVATDSDKVIFLDDYVDLTHITVTDWYPTLGIFPAEGIEVDSLFNQLHGKHPEMAIYKKEDIPAELGYNNHRRIPPIVGILGEAWATTDRAYFDTLKDRLDGGATHGYLPGFKSMHGVFIAEGPAFKAGQNIDSVNSVDIYELMCHILGLTPADNDGSLESFNPVLNN